jgi:2-polyprenyl-3-methyl-5-hydroxy-6-metoxy-1,4-benzoquinol methylase
MQEHKKIWDDFWRETNLSSSYDRSVLRQELASIRWKKIENNILAKYGSFKGLRVIEVGSGRGEIASLMAIKGARVSLLDYSSIALERAQALFKNLELDADFIIADAMDIPKELLGKFDISISFGLAEHFTYPQRKTVFQVHRDLLNNRGSSFVEVPNKYCLPYIIFKKLAQFLGYWSVGLEIPFSRLELKRIADLAGFKTYEIVGSSFLRDSVYFLIIRFISHLTKWRIIVDTSCFEIASIMDNYLGHSLILIGSKT